MTFLGIKEDKLKESISIILGQDFTLTISPLEKSISFADESVTLYYNHSKAQKGITLEIYRSTYGVEHSIGAHFRIEYPQSLLSYFELESVHEVDDVFSEFITFKAPKSIVYHGRLTVKLNSLLNNISPHMQWNASNTIGIISLLLQILSASAHCCEAMNKKNIQFDCAFLVNEQSQQKILQAQEYLNKHIYEPITIKQLSKIVGMNECYLKRGFKEMTGKTINEYFQELRIRSAIELLKSKKMNVTEVSEHLGFKSLSHFSSSIKKYTGVNACDIIGW